VTLSIRDPEPTRRLLEGTLGFSVVGTEGNRLRFGVSGGGAGNVLDILHQPEAPSAVNGLGTVHHVALAIGTDEEQLAVRADLIEQGFHVTEVRDRNYFHSIYFREPGGVLFEIATIPPGFGIDEEAASLGRSLKLPAWEEPQRAAIEAALPAIVY
jgi:glyoxalase family protein